MNGQGAAASAFLWLLVRATQVAANQRQQAHFASPG